MRRLTSQDLPMILRSLKVPRQIRHQLGDYSEYGQPGQPLYSELDVYGCDPNEQLDNPFGIDGHSLGMLQNSPGDAAGFDSINWTCVNYNGAQQVTYTADPKRVVLIVENLSSNTTPVPIAVNFGTGASTVGNSPPGLQLLQQGSVLYVDRYCPTNDIYISLPAVSSPSFAACAVVMGTRGEPKRDCLGMTCQVAPTDSYGQSTG